MTFMTDVGNRIRKHRQAAGWTVDELAALADIDARRLADMEDGSSFPTQYECGALERALPGCSPQELGILAYGDTYRGVPGFDATLDED
jgi:transcriptional regulator with XRE-family HTH domain